MKINKEWLRDQNACKSGRTWFCDNFDDNVDRLDVLDALIKEGRLDWANWLIVRTMEKKQYIKYAVFSAEQVSHISAAAYASHAAASAAVDYAGDSIAASYATAAARSAADSYAAYSNPSGNYAAYAASKKEMMMKILNNGIEIIKKGET